MEQVVINLADDSRLGSESSEEEDGGKWKI
jgi:hypothetical protein